MANTTNYNWETPDDTDLVKDGAAAIRTLGSSIDTTTKNLNPQTTTGALAYRSATANVNTALPIGTAGQVLRVNSGATAPEWATTADQTPLTTKGDLFGFDTADARIPVGTNGHILTADSTQALGVKWAAPAASGFTFQAWTPTFTNLSLGNGTLTARYGTSGKFTHFELFLTFGSTTSVSGVIKFTLPTTPKNKATDQGQYVPTMMLDAGTQIYFGMTQIPQSGPAEVYVTLANTTYVERSGTSSTVPFTWTTNDELIVVGNYEEA